LHIAIWIKKFIGWIGLEPASELGIVKACAVVKPVQSILVLKFLAVIKTAPIARIAPLLKN
jgi:hypothetical protein